MKKLLLLSLILPAFSFAQFTVKRTHTRKCATYQEMESFRKTHPGAETDQQFESWLAQKKNLQGMRMQNTVTLPVVFHIIYSDATDNVSQALIQQQILQLNKDFSNQSASTYGVAANTDIQFALAKTNPSGDVLPEPGIDRVLYSSKGFDAPPYTVTGAGNTLTSVIKPATIWNPAAYINLWVLPMADGVLGIATFPATSGLSGLNNSETNNTAGVAVDPLTIGSVFTPGSCGQYGKGRTLTHELGHFFGLRHIWGDATCGTDYCADTPPHEDANGGVPVHPKANACGTTDEMFENYMDYTDDAVTNTFTADQVARMKTVLANSPRRGSLSTSAVGLVTVAGTNRLAFADCSGAMTVNETGSTGTSPRYTDYSFMLEVENKATGAATVTINAGGTATSGVNYQLLTPTLTFADGDNFKLVKLRVLDNALAESNKTVVLSYSISGAGVAAGTAAQTLTLTLLDDDNGKVTQNPITLLSQNWEASATGWTTLRTTGFINRFVIGPKGDAGGTGNAAYISDNATTLDNEYSPDMAGASALRTPLLDATGLRDLQLSFKYKVWGEIAGNTAIDYGMLLSSTQAAPTDFLDINAAGTGPYAGIDDVDSDNPVIALPNADFANKSFYLSWYWENDDVDGNNPALNIDDIVLTGSGTKVETAVSSSYGYPVDPGAGIYNFRSSANSRMIVRLTNASTALSGVTASVLAAGNGQATITTSKGTYQRTQKVFKVTPATPASSASYRITLFFTQAELAVWGANKLNLKVLKVKDGVSLSDPLNSSNAIAVTPVSATEDAAAGVISYTADFTNGFSQFVLVSADFALPVNLLTFDATPQKKAIELSWTTATETANKGFAIERSTNGVDFSDIGWVKGAGTTTNSSNYHFTDNYVQPNTTYQYRLRQTDFDNQVKYSLIRQARIADNGVLLTVSPNPAKTTLKVFVAGVTGPVSISLVNAGGQEVVQWKAVNPSSGLVADISRFAKGVYTVVVHLPEGNKTTSVVLQ